MSPSVEFSLWTMEHHSADTKQEAMVVLIKNIRIENAEELSDILIKDGRFFRIAPGQTPDAGEEVVDGSGRLALPPFIESHIHLDSALTAGQPRWNLSGTLFEGIECWEDRKKQLTREDLRERIGKVVRLQAAQGVQYVRTHVDINDPELIALKTLLELREELADLITIQIVAFPQYGICSFPGGAELLEEALKLGADAAGAIPHYEFTREYAVKSLEICFDLAEKYGKLIDIHCDEIDDESSRNLETVATLAYESGMSDRVTASHTTAMHSYNNAYVARLMRILKLSGINFVANPIVNMHLGGRLDSYPKRRSMTRVRELSEAGCNVSFGNDDLFDPWNPLGNGGMRDAVFTGVLAGHLMGYRELMDSYKYVTVNAARTLHLGENYGIREGAPASFVLLDGPNYYDVLAYNKPVIASFRNGHLISSTRPAESEILV